jgi:uncharacterized protein
MRPPTGIFVDTSGWMCYLDSSQPQHRDAVTLVQVCAAEAHHLTTTNHVMAELVALLTSRALISRSQLVSTLRTLRSSPHIEIIHIDPVIEDAAYDLLAARLDKEWSLVDCMSFVVMRERRISEALTTDHHFEQAGYVRLLP